MRPWVETSTWGEVKIITGWSKTGGQQMRLSKVKSRRWGRRGARWGGGQGQVKRCTSTLKKNMQREETDSMTWNNKLTIIPIAKQKRKKRKTPGTNNTFKRGCWRGLFSGVWCRTHVRGLSWSVLFSTHILSLTVKGDICPFSPLILQVQSLSLVVNDIFSTRYLQKPQNRTAFSLETPSVCLLVCLEPLCWQRLALQLVS